MTDPRSMIPPFPDTVPTHPLLVIDYGLLKKRDEGEVQRLWKAATELGFWYLKNHGAEREADRMFDLGAEVMKLPLEEKMKYEQGDEGSSFGYKAAGANAMDATGRLDNIEFLNIAKDDALAFPNVAYRTYPEPAMTEMRTTITPFIERSLDVTETILDIFSDKLGFPKGTLLSLHRREEPSGCQSRIILSPPPAKTEDTATLALSSHTDFGSLSFLHNRLGGLQVLPPGCTEWQYVKPLPNHAICNIGDALTILSGGILRSNLHRVVSPPGAQVTYERWSLVFFLRPGNGVALRPLVDQSEIIAAKIRDAPEEERLKWNTGVTAQEWLERRVRNRRIKNRKGPETWMASGGTERVGVI